MARRMVVPKLTIPAWMRSIARSKAGIVVLVLLAVTVLGAVAAVFIVPSGFPEKWYDLKRWQEYPKLARPEIVKYFGIPVLTTVSKNAKLTVKFFEPGSTIAGVPIVGAAQVYSIIYRYSGSGGYPTDIQYVLRIETSKEFDPLVTMLAIVVRPDGKDVIIAPPYVGRLSEAPNTISFDTRAFSEYANRLGVKPTDAMMHGIRLLFSKPSSEGLKPLPGIYKVMLIIVYPSFDEETLKYAVDAGVGVTNVKVIVKGNTYGLFGTDAYGRPLGLALAYGFPIELLIGILGGLITTLIGFIAGILSGFYGGRLSYVIDALADIANNLPLIPILLAIGLVVASEPTSPYTRLAYIIIAMALVAWGQIAVSVKPLAASLRVEPYVESLRNLGVPERHILLNHIIPALLPLAAVNLAYSIPSAILAEASIVLLGVHHGIPTWGTLISDAISYMRAGGTGAWWWLAFPGIAIAYLSTLFMVLAYVIERAVSGGR